jgi:hypothetical protein
LELITHPKDDVVQAQSLIGRLPWNRPLRSRGVSTLEFIGFLGASWLSDTQIDMMVEVLQNQMKTKECFKEVLVEPLTFFWELVSVGNKLKEALTSRYLLKLVDQIQAGTPTIWFPINVNDNHWITGRVDFQDQTFAFGEC